MIVFGNEYLFSRVGHFRDSTVLKASRRRQFPWDTLWPKDKRSLRSKNKNNGGNSL